MDAVTRDAIRAMERTTTELRGLLAALEVLSDCRAKTGDVDLNQALAKATLNCVEPMRIAMTRLPMVATAVFVRSEMDYLADPIEGENQ